jgi:site-specific DNA-methyltransferase (cytosine-N4-specific)
MAQLVAVFREVRRVLKDDGTVWLNLGDSYAANRSYQVVDNKYIDVGNSKASSVPDGLKPKDLVGIPWRVAFALQADGWYLRSDIIWHKPNPMPESVTDRPTKAHEYLFLLSKNERYFYDADAIAEPVAESQVGRVRADAFGGVSWQGRQQHSAGSVYRLTSRDGVFQDRYQFDAGPSWQSGEGGGLQSVHDEGADGGEFPAGVDVVNGRQLNHQVEVAAKARVSVSSHMNIKQPDTLNVNRRNKRSVWTIPTQPYAGAHFATMPEALVTPCILAGSRDGDLVLDPFSGSGTVLAVANRLGRRSVGCDINPVYHDLAKTRTAQRGLRF